MKNIFLTNFDSPVSLLGKDGVVLVVDDSPDYHELTKVCFQMSKKGNELVFLSSGNELLEYMNQVRGGTKPFPAVILLDVNMPGIDGFEALREIKKYKEFERIPVVIMCTNSSAVSDKNLAEQCGANGFWTKPSSINDYVQFFDNL